MVLVWCDMLFRSHASYTKEARSGVLSSQTLRCCGYWLSLHKLLWSAKATYFLRFDHGSVAAKIVNDWSGILCTMVFSHIKNVAGKWMFIASLSQGHTFWQIPQVVTLSSKLNPQRAEAATRLANVWLICVVSLISPFCSSKGQSGKGWLTCVPEGQDAQHFQTLLWA